MRFNQPPNYVPSLEEIAAACRSLQIEWDAYERFRRSGGLESEAATIPQLNYREVMCGADDGRRVKPIA